jgi:hypothetical protein
MMAASSVLPKPLVLVADADWWRLHERGADANDTMQDFNRRLSTGTTKELGQADIMLGCK